MASFKNADAGIIVDQLIKTIQEQRDYLSEIDGKIGDGDHGINMNKGFTMCEDKLKGKTYNLSEGLSIPWGDSSRRYRRVHGTAVRYAV